ncbi:hypothetical protein ACQKLM_25955 [Bacillus thuringiensis]|uniref:hypothetical protein n=1 Tax=Bacillus thuringiensis TaxID=1428 RepID=UPI003D06A7F0
MYKHSPTNLVACICEGNAEVEIIELLLEHNKLPFLKSSLLDEKPLTGTMRSARNLETRYLGQIFEPGQRIEIIRIVDSKSEKYSIRHAYQKNISGIFHFFTTPEIEMLIIINENKYNAYKRSNKKPSKYCSEDLKMKNIKQKGFISNYFSNINTLITALQKYHQIRPDKDMDTIYSLIN